MIIIISYTFFKRKKKFILIHIQYIVPDPLLLPPQPLAKKKKSKTKQTKKLNRLKKDEKTLSQGEFKGK